MITAYGTILRSQARSHDDRGPRFGKESTSTASQVGENLRSRVLQHVLPAANTPSARGALGHVDACGLRLYVR
jgi:hypothetical protein